MSIARFDPRAVERVAQDSARYDAERPGRGTRFEQAVLEAAELVMKVPSAGRFVSGDAELRRWNVRCFPYSLIYAEVPGGVVVLHVVHHKRRPDAWRDDVNE